MLSVVGVNVDFSLSPDPDIDQKRGLLFICTYDVDPLSNSGHVL